MAVTLHQAQHQTESQPDASLASDWESTPSPGSSLHDADIRGTGASEYTERPLPSMGLLENRRRTNPAGVGRDTTNRMKKLRSIDPLPTKAGYLEPLPHSPQVSSRQRSSGRKRLHPEPDRPSDTYDPPLKRPRTDKDRLIEHWTQNQFTWPKKFLPEPSIMEQSFARPEPPTLRRTKSNVSLSTTSEITYANKNYETYLETKGCFMYENVNSIDPASHSTCRKLLRANPPIPRDTVFDIGVFELTCRRVQTKNKTGLIRLIGELIVPSAESIIDYGQNAYPYLVVSVDEAWDCSIPLDESQQLLGDLPCWQQFQLPRPQPYYAVGFTRQAFTETQLQKLAPFIGIVGDTSLFMGTEYMFFPFMTAEVICGKAALDLADRKNMHSTTLSVRGVVRLFRLVKRENELHRQILAFSVSHDHRTVRIYGHYPVIDGERTTYYRHSIREYCLPDLEGRDRWTSYKFLMRLYGFWARYHLDRLRSAIDGLPTNFGISQSPRQSVSGS
ncbi:hypothetical protein FQN55_003942 [Onygenales sp. PD_40]|nr:hypothetical protein FQN55_003942 [Onygenales sp. PD_40]